MTDRNAVWAAAYGAYCATRFASFGTFGEKPTEDWWERVRGHARDVADAAVEELREQEQPTCSGCGSASCSHLFSTQRKCCPDCTCKPVQPQKRDESSDVWVWNSMDESHTPYAMTHDEFSRIRHKLEKHVLSGERYVPHSQLVAAQRDSELLDAILYEFDFLRNALKSNLVHSDWLKELWSKLELTIAERGKR